MKWECQLFFLVMFLLNGIGHFKHIEEGRVLPEKPEAQESVLTVQVKVESKLSDMGNPSKKVCSQYRTIIKNNSDTGGSKKKAVNIISLLTSVCYSDIMYDLFSDIIPLDKILKNIKLWSASEKVGKKQKSYKVPCNENISYIPVRSSPTKLKLKCDRALNENNKKQISYNREITKECSHQKYLLSEQKTNVDSLNNNVNIAKRVTSDPKNQITNGTIILHGDDSVHGNVFLGKGNENSVFDPKNLNEEKSTFVRKNPEYLNRDSNLKLKKKGFVLELRSIDNLESLDDVNTTGVIGPKIMDVPFFKQESALHNVVEKDKNTECSESVCSRPLYPKYKKNDFSKDTKKISVSEKIDILDSEKETVFKEVLTPHDEIRKEESTTCSETVCSRSKYPKSKSGAQYSEGTEKLNVSEKMDINIVGADKLQNEYNTKEKLFKVMLKPHDEIRKEESKTCSEAVCSRSQHPKLMNYVQNDEDPKKLKISEKKDTNIVGLDTVQSENNTNELTETLEGIIYLLLDRLQQIIEKPMDSSGLQNNISLLIEKMELLKSGIESLSHMGNNILTPGEEALITGLVKELSEVDSNNSINDTMKLMKREDDGYLIDDKRQVVFFSAWGQCAVCITVAKKFDERFKSILKTVDFKDIPPAYLNLGDDWCMDFSNSSSCPILSEFQKSWPEFFNVEKMSVQFQHDLRKEFIEKCSLYRSLISDVHLYRHWLHNNHDMIKTLCNSDYSIEFKSCAPFLL